MAWGRAGVAVVLLLLGVGTLASVGTAADAPPGVENNTTVPGTPSNETFNVSFPVPDGNVTVTGGLDCTLFWANVTPDDWWYALELTYLDTSTGRYYSLYAGPFNETVVDPFGRTDLVLVDFELVVSGVGTLSGRPPDRCLTETPFYSQSR
ncbi:hypothetical protein ACFQH6_18855 [Halobacteriaceae archaeon GCM10025711]